MKRCSRGASPDYLASGDRRRRPAGHQLHQRHDGAAEGRDDHASQRVPELVGTLLHHPMSSPANATCGRCRCFTRTDGRSSGSSTAVGGTHVCLPQGRCRRRVRPRATRAHHDAVRRADGAHRHRRTRPTASRAGAPRGVRVLTAGAPPAAATIERVEGELGWTVTQVYGLTETRAAHHDVRAAPEHAVLEPGRPRAHQGAPGRRADHVGRAPRRRRTTATKCRTTAAPSARSSCAATW